MSLIPRAFVLGAGLGTRLRPLTDDLPKPLIPIFQKPLITFALDHLMAAGVGAFVINTHRLPERFRDLFGDGTYRGRSVTLVHEPQLLETGGGIKNAEAYFRDGPFITYSGDILTDVNLPLLIEEHFRSSNDVTLGLRQTRLAAGVAFRDNRVVDIGGKFGISGNFDFANIAVWAPSVFSRIPPAKKMSFVPVLIEWIRAGGKIGGVILDQGNWFNIGSRNEYLEVHRVISGQGWRPAQVAASEWPRPQHQTAQIDPTAKVLGCSVVAANCRVGGDAVLEDTILWTGAQIASRTHLCRCIVRSHRTASGSHHDADI